MLYLISVYEYEIHYYCLGFVDENAIVKSTQRLREAMGDDLGDEWWDQGEDLGMFL